MTVTFYIYRLSNPPSIERLYEQPKEGFITKPEAITWLKEYLEKIITTPYKYLILDTYSK